MPEWLYVVGQVVLWMLFGLAACFAFIIILACGQYEFRPQQRRRQSRPVGCKPNPPRADTNVQPPREVRCADPVRPDGNFYILRNGQVVGYECQSEPNADGLVQTARLVKLED